MANSLLTSSIISKETLMQVENNLVLAKAGDWSYSEKFGNKDAQIGASYRIRRPMIYTVSTSMEYVPQNTVEGEVFLTVGNFYNISFQFDDVDLALKIEKFSDRFVKQAALSLANAFDKDVASAFSNCTTKVAGDYQTGANWVVGAYGTSLTKEAILTAKQMLLEAGCPDDGEVYGFLTPKANAELAAANLSLFSAQKATQEIYTKGYVGEFAGIEFSTAQTLASHTNGTQVSLALTSTPLTSGWAETATVTVPAISGAIKAGDVFTVAGVYAVNPLTKQATSSLQMFTVVSDVAASGTTVRISPAPIISGSFQNITSTINGKTATLVGAAGASGQESLIFHKKALALASPKFVVPKSGFDMAETMEGVDTGISMRFLRGYDAIGASGTVGFVNRLDAMAAFKITRPEFAVRIRN